MKSWIPVFAIALAIAHGVLAQEAEGRRGSLFISPCGRPYRAVPGQPYPVAEWFRRADRNHDGFLDRSEFRAEAAEFFMVLDSNHDGVIDLDEVNAYERILVPEILRGCPPGRAMIDARIFLAQYGGGGGGGGGGGHGGHHRNGGSGSAAKTPDPAQSEMVGAAPYGLLAEPEPVTAADTEFNGRITLPEFLAAADRRFGILDAKQTGRIAFADLPQTAVQTRQGGREHHRQEARS